MTPAFKEWSLVCDALESGRQHILLRKGGIAEERGGFSFKHREFCLFPTHFHAQREQTTLGPRAEVRPSCAGEIEIRCLAEAVWTAQITAWDVVPRLAPYHVWIEALLRRRFEQDGVKCLHLAVVRVFRLEPAWVLPDAPAYGGCRSWVDLPSLPDNILRRPVCDEKRHQEIAVAVRKICEED